MKFSPVFTPIHQSHEKLINPAQFWRTAKLSYILLYFLQHNIENITLNADCSFEIYVAEDAHVFIFHSCLLSGNYDLCKRSIECEQEDDGRWLAEVPDLPGVLAYGSTPDLAASKAEALALRVLAERLETLPSSIPHSSFFAPQASLHRFI
jgi:predicted RNase H-like HicB family nuclease